MNKLLPVPTDTQLAPADVPPMTKEIYLELIEALDELDSAFAGATAESVNARLWVEQYWRTVDNKPK